MGKSLWWNTEEALKVQCLVQLSSQGCTKRHKATAQLGYKLNIYITAQSTFKSECALIRAPRSIYPAEAGGSCGYKWSDRSLHSHTRAVLSHHLWNNRQENIHACFTTATTGHIHVGLKTAAAMDVQRLNTGFGWIYTWKDLFPNVADKGSVWRAPSCPLSPV